jgi:hypothetical protein
MTWRPGVMGRSTEPSYGRWDWDQPGWLSGATRSYVDLVSKTRSYKYYQLGHLHNNSFVKDPYYPEKGSIAFCYPRLEPTPRIAAHMQFSPLQCRTCFGSMSWKGWRIEGGRDGGWMKEGLDSRGMVNLDIILDFSFLKHLTYLPDTEECTFS